MRKFKLYIIGILLLTGITTQAQFITTWTTADTQITIPTFGTGYSYDITWTNLTNAGVGDGSITGQTGNYTISGLTNGDVYQVEITGAFPRIYFNNTGDKDKILTVEQWGTNTWTSMAYAFYGCTNLTSTAIDVPDLTGVTSMRSMFSRASSFNSDISGWNVSNVTDMWNMFSNATLFNQNLNTWNVSQVTTMASMFHLASNFNGNISSWNVSSVTNMSEMFAKVSAFNQDISGWNVSSVTDMYSMFWLATSFNQNIGAWNVSNVTTMWNMFGGASAFNQDISGWIVSSVTGMNQMFDNATAFNQNIGAWDVSSVTNMSTMFRNATAFNQDLGTWVVGNVTNMASMFEATNTNLLNLNLWDVSKVLNMSRMFFGATTFNGNISGWIVGSVTNMASMFENATSFNQNIGAWVVSSVTDMNSIFAGAMAFNQPIGGWNIGSLTMLWKTFDGASSFNQDISTWNLTNIIDLGFTFRSASAFNQDLSAWNVANVTSMYSTFSNATAFDQSLATWDISNVIELGLMLDNTALSTVNYDATLVSWNTLLLQSGLSLGAVGLTYCSATTARANIIATYGWTITDAGSICPLILSTLTPQNNKINIALNSNIDMIFNDSVDPATLNSLTIIITGVQSGVISGAFIGGGTNAITFNPTMDFKPGEVVRITLTRNLLSLTGGSLDYPLSLEFRVGSITGPTIPNLLFDEATTTISTVADGANTVFAIDVDGDGDMDVLSSSQTANKIAWYENDGSQGFTERIVSTSALAVQHVYAADIDQDGDIDILSASRSDGKLVWYENDGFQAFTERTISYTGTTFAYYMALPRDVDGDGDIDIIGANRVEDKIAWYENDGSQNFTERVVSLNANSIRSVYGIDVDGDGDMDLLSASVNDDKIAWYENDGQQGFTERIISLNANSARIVYAADMDNDGDVDVLSASFSDDKIAWYENDGSQVFTERVISLTADGARGMFAIDVDADGDMDVLSASRNADKVVWYENDGSQGFTERLISSTTNSVRWVYATDVDGDGDIDALAASTNDNKIAWFENGGITPTVPLLNVVSVTPTENSIGIALNANISFTFDQAIDGATAIPDNILIAGEQTGFINGTFSGLGTTIITFDPTTNFKPGEVIRIYLSSGIQSTGGDPLIDGYRFEFRIITQDGPETPDFFYDDPATIISSTATSANVVFAADIDGDGDMDVLSSSQTANKIAWYENDGSQGFTEFIVSTNAVDIQQVYAVDLDKDGDMDLMSASRADDKIAWYENDGAQNFTEKNISLGANGAYMAYPYDIDGDGDMDVLVAARYDDEVAWYENDGLQNFTERIISLNANSVRSIYGIDIDDDGDMDVLSASSNDNKIAWYENDGAEHFIERVISTTAMSAKVVYAIDMDGDGDIDVLSASYTDDKIAWYENDGNQQFTERVISLTADGARSVYAIDADGDGDIDVMSASRFADKVAWYENDGLQNFTEHIVTLATNSVRGVYASDVDGDGDVDILAASSNDNRIVWFKNTTLICYNPPTVVAGLSQVICETETVSLNATIGGPASTITWTTDGDGGFDDNTSLTAFYNPGAADISNGIFTLTITTDDADGTEPCIAAFDDIIIDIEYQYIVDAGVDQTICAADKAPLTGTTDDPSQSILWSTAGDGTFDDNLSLIPIYTPGAADLAAGVVTLTLESLGANACMPPLDNIIIAISQSIVVIDQSASLDVAQTVIIDVTTGGTFNTGDVLTTTLLTQPVKGTATVNVDASISYTSSPGTADADGFDFEVCNQCGQCSTASVAININNVAPVINITSPTIQSGAVIVIDLFAGITDINDNIDLTSLTIITQPSSGALASIDASGNLTIDYTGLKFAGTDQLTIEICDLDGLCTAEVITIVVEPPGVVVYNVISPNGDNKHDFLEIENAEFFDGNQVKIMNRWGDVVFEIDNYDNDANKFIGIANKGGNGELPTGTYYYNILLGDGSKAITGFFALRR